METKQAPIKCSKCGSTKIREVLLGCNAFNDFEFNEESGNYKMVNEDVEGGTCSIECLNCGEIFDEPEYNLWIEQTRIYFDGTQVW